LLRRSMATLGWRRAQPLFRISPIEFPPMTKKTRCGPRSGNAQSSIAPLRRVPHANPYILQRSDRPTTRS
jgi:hypothetical protein